MKKLSVVLVLAGLVLPVAALADDYSKTGTGPVKVFLLIGQSNMNGRGGISVLKDKLIKDQPDKYPASLMDLRKDVWIRRANGDGISGQKDNKCLEPGFGQWKYYGPELGFGHVMGDHFKQQVLFVKVIGGGTALGKEWVSPSQAKRTGRPVGHMYKRAIRETIQDLWDLPNLYKDYKPEMGYQLAGVFWCQGNADGGQFAKEYADNLADFINDLRSDFGVPDLPFIAAESLSSRTPGEQFVKGCEMVNAQQKNKQAAAIPARSKIDLKGAEYSPYNSSGDSTHWRGNSKAYLDVGYWAADLMIPMLKGDVDQSKDAKIQQKWKDVLPQMLEPEEEKQPEKKAAK